MASHPALRGPSILTHPFSPREPYNLTSDSEHVYHEIVRDTFQQIDLVRRLTEHFPASLVPASSVAEIRNNFNHHPGRISSLLGIEGLHQIGTSPSILRVYHQLGVRYASLTHTCHNHYADSEAPADAQHHGLSAAGEALVAEMNRLGMIVDLSHTSRETQRAALALSRAPVMYSHSSAYALCPHSRNVDDESLRLLQQNDGIIMITFYPEYTNCEDPEAATLADVADHIQYVGNLIGYRHVGLGSDFDGMARGPKGLEDVSKYPNLVQELLDRGVAVDDVVAVVGGNVLRVLEAVEKVAHTSRHLLPLEDDVKPFFG
jgi:membrane dipeptidase